MPNFSKQSMDRLLTCHYDLQRLFQEVVKRYDCTVIEGHRNKEDQEAAFRAGNSDKHYPFGKHNATPSNAVDVAPYPVDWNDPARFHLFAGYVLGTATMMNIPIRWGGDWNGNWDLKDQKLVDLPHFELNR